MVQRPQRREQQNRPRYKPQQQTRYHNRPLQLPERVYKRRIRCWQCHDQVEEAPILFCTKCHARLLWYNLHLEPGDKPISYSYPEGQLTQSVPKHYYWPGMFAYERVQGVAGQYKIAALYKCLLFPSTPVAIGYIEVFDDDTLERQVFVGPYDSPWKKQRDYSEPVKAGDYKWFEYLTTGLVPGNIIIVRIIGHEMAYEQKDIYRVLPERIVRVGKTERELIRTTRRMGVYIDPPEQTADMWYLPLVDLDNLDESVWLEGVHHPKAQPSFDTQLLKDMQALIEKPAAFWVSNNFANMRLVEKDPRLAEWDPDRFGGREIGFAGWTKTREKELEIEPDELPIRISLTNKQAGLIVYVGSPGGKIHLDLAYNERKRIEQENYYIPNAGFFGGMDAVVEAYPVGEGTKYAAVFTVPLPLRRLIEEPRSYTTYYLNTRDSIPVGLKPGEVEVIDLLK